MKPCLTTYNLHCAYYLTTPGFVFDAILYCVKIELELFCSYEMYLMIERWIRGEESVCIKKHAMANNKDTHETYNNTLPITYQVYLDANNLYGWVMNK